MGVAHRQEETLEDHARVHVAIQPTLGLVEVLKEFEHGGQPCATAPLGHPLTLVDV